MREKANAKDTKVLLSTKGAYLPFNFFKSEFSEIYHFSYILRSFNGTFYCCFNDKCLINKSSSLAFFLI